MQKYGTRAAMKNKKPKKASTARTKPKKWVLPVIAIIVFVILVILLLSGVIKLPESSLTNKVCGDDTVSRYKDIVNPVDSDDVSAISSGIIALGNEVRQRDNFGKDANCLYIVTKAYMEEKRWSDAHLFVTELKQLVSEGKDGISEELTTLSPDEIEEYMNYAFLMNEAGKGNE